MTKKRIIGWTLAGIVAFLAVLLVGGFVVLRSSWFHQYALNKIEQAATQATGGRAEVQGLDVSLSGLTAHLYGITLRGTESAGQPPLLQADKLTVSITIQSLFHPKVTLRELLIEHPVVHVQVNRQGQNNLPQAPPSQSSGHTNVFDLAVGHIQITNGEVNYNDRKTPVEADLYSLGTDIRFSALPKRYYGTISYSNGHLKYAGYSPLRHNFKLNFNATPDRLTVESAELNVGSSQALLHAAVSDYSDPVANADYQIRLHAQDFASMSPSATAAGDVFVTGKLRYRSEPNEPLLRSIAVDGQIASEALHAVSSGRAVDVHKLQGQYQLADGVLRVSNVRMETLGGSLTSDAEMQNLDTTPSTRLRTSLHGISLRALQQALQSTQLKAANISGTVSGVAEASWKGSVSNIQARSDLTVKAEARSTANPSSTEVPVNGAIHATYDGPRQSLTLRDTALTMPSATVTAQGQVSDRSNLQIQILARDLHQLAELVSSFGATQSAPPAISGSASFSATVHGSMKRPTIAGQLNAHNLKVQGSEWTAMRFDVQASPSQASISNGALSNANQGQATFDASVGLKNWAYLPSSPIQANLLVQRMRVDDLQRLANAHYPVSGELSAKMSVHGSQLDPVGSGTAQIINARAYDEPIQNLALKFNAANGTIVSTLNLAVAAGALDANLSYTPKSKAYKVKLDAPGVVLQKLRMVQEKNLQLSGTVTASVEGAGTVDDPQLNAIVQLPQLQLRDKSISGLKAEVHVANHRADLNLDSQVSQSTVKAHGRVNLTDGYYTEAAIDTSAIPLDVLMATYAHGAPEGFQGQTELHATLKGPLKDKSRLEAHVTIPTFNASYQQFEMGISNPIRADYVDSVVTLQPAEIRGTGTSLHVQGRMPIGGNSAPTLSAQGSIDVRVFRILAPDINSSGVLAIDVRTSGAANAPQVQGQIHLKDVAFSTIDAPLGVEKLNGTIDVASDKVRLSDVTGEVGGGKVALAGSIAYRPNLQFNVAMQGQSIRLRYPEGLRTLLDTNLAFSGTTQASTLNGRVLINSLSFTPEFDLAKFGDQFSTGTSTPSEPGIADTVQLAIGVQSKENLNATSAQVSIAGRVALQVIGTAANPVITGRTNLSSGELFFRNLRYQLQRGVITFDDPNQTHPVLNVSVSTNVQQYNLTLTMRGPLDKLTTSYVADPPLATADIINLIARGKTTQEANATSQSTDSMIAAGAASELSSGVQKLAGISSLQIDPMIGGNNQNPSARVAIQQRVTKNLYFTFSTDVSQPGSEIVQGEYQINRRWSVSVARDQLGGVSVDGKYHTRF